MKGDTTMVYVQSTAPYDENTVVGIMNKLWQERAPHPCAQECLKCRYRTERNTCTKQNNIDLRQVIVCHESEPIEFPQFVQLQLL